MSNKTETAIQKERDVFMKKIFGSGKRSRFDKELDKVPALPEDSRTFKLQKKEIENGKSQKAVRTNRKKKAD